MDGSLFKNKLKIVQDFDIVNGCKERRKTIGKTDLRLDGKKELEKIIVKMNSERENTGIEKDKLPKGVNFGIFKRAHEVIELLVD